MDYPLPGTTKGIQGTRTFLLQPHHQHLLQLQTVKGRIAATGCGVCPDTQHVQNAGAAVNFSLTAWSFLLPYLKQRSGTVSHGYFWPPVFKGVETSKGHRMPKIIIRYDY